MIDAGWGQLFVAALSGGLTVKFLDIAYEEWRKQRDKSDSAEQFVDRHLDPLLKAADELVGKLRSLSEDDFRAINRVSPSDSRLENTDFAGLLYLFGCFWAQVEVIRQEGMSVALTKDVRGLRLQSFFDCLEGRRVRIVPRVLQRAVGETFRTEKGTKTFIEFVAGFETDNGLKRWVMPLATFLSRTEHTTERQQLLQYGVVLHAMIDLLDPKHTVSRDRPSMANKLTTKSWRALNYRVFGVYLKFVKNRKKYIGMPKASNKTKISKPKKAIRKTG